MQQTQTHFLAPLKSSVYSVLLMATIFSNIGTWMHEVGASWLMTELTRSPIMIAMVQTMTTLPVFLFALPAGALADIMDKRKLLILVQLIMGFIAAAMALMVHSGLSQPVWVLLFTFLLGTGAAFVAPAWQAIVPKLVAKPHLSSAIALNGVGINISRAIGPALAGFLIVSFGLYAPFVFNALSFLAIIGALLWWRDTASKKDDLPAESLFHAMVAGFRFAHYSRPLKNTLIRAVAFFLFASAFWALLPLVVKQQLDGDATAFGSVMGAIGAGAVFGAVFLPTLKRILSSNCMVVFTSLIIAVLLVVTSLLNNVYILFLVSFSFGMAWIWTLATLNVAAQSSLPDWVRGRGLAIFLTVFFGSLSLGSTLWGTLATTLSLSLALQISAGIMVLATLLTYRVSLDSNQEDDLSPSMHWPAPIVDHEFSEDSNSVNERSPVMVTIEYRIEKVDHNRFLGLMQELKLARMQLGAWQWNIMQDAEDPNVFVEYFLETSWLAHLRHHKRVAGKDRELQAQINQLHCGDEKPVIRHLLGAVVATEVQS